MQRLFLIFICLFTLSCKSVYRQPTEPFEEKLRLFRYSLYADMSSLKWDDLKTMNFFNNPQIKNKLSQFIEGNQHEIEAYQQSILEKYQHNTLPETQWKAIEVNKNSYQLLSEGFKSEFKLVHALISIHPFEYAEWMITTYLAHELTTEKIATYHIQNNIGRSLILTRPISTEKWKIIIDKYTYRFEFIFNLQNKELVFEQILKRV